MCEMLLSLGTPLTSAVREWSFTNESRSGLSRFDVTRPACTALLFSINRSDRCFLE